MAGLISHDLKGSRWMKLCNELLLAFSKDTDGASAVEKF